MRTVHPIDQIQVAFCPCRVKRYCHFFLSDRRSYWSCLTVIDATSRHFSFVEPQKSQILYKAHGLLRWCHLHLEPGSFDKIFWRIWRLQFPTTVPESRSWVHLCISFHWFAPNLVPVAYHLNKRLCRGQEQAFDGLTVDEVYALEMLKENLWRTFRWLLHARLTPVMEMETHVTSTLAVFWYRKDLIKEID